MWHRKTSGNTKARDEVAQLMASVIIRGKQSIAVRLNSWFNGLSKSKQLGWLWSAGVIILLLIIVTSLKFNTVNQRHMTGNYLPVFIGQSPVKTTVSQPRHGTDSTNKKQ